MIPSIAGLAAALNLLPARTSPDDVGSSLADPDVCPPCSGAPTTSTTSSTAAAAAAPAAAASSSVQLPAPDSQPQVVAAEDDDAILGELKQINVLQRTRAHRSITEHFMSKAAHPQASSGACLG